MQKENRLLGIPFSIISKTIALISVLAGVMIVLGWQINNHSFKTLLLSDISAKANGGACIILSGISLWLVQYRSGVFRIIVRVLSSVVILVSLLTIIETVFSIDLGIDTILFNKAFVAGDFTGSYRMAFNASLSHFLVGVILYFLSTDRKRFTLFYIFCHILVFSISLLGLVGFLFGLADFSEQTGYNNMPPQAAFLFLYQAAGLFLTYYTFQPVRIEIEYRFFAGIIFAASVILFIALLSNVEFKSTRQVITGVENNRLLKARLDHLLSDMAEVETSISGYLITDNKVYLDHFADAEADVPVLLEELADIVKVNDIQTERFLELTFIIDEKFLGFRKMIETRESKGTEAGLESFRKYKSELLSGELEEIVDIMISDENHYLNIKSEKLNTNSANARKIIYLNLFVQVFFLAVIFIVVSRNISERKIAIKEAMSLNDELERKIKERTALLTENQKRTRELNEANRELESFTYSVSHDLRAPLRHVNGFTDLLVNEYSSQLPEKAQHYLSTIKESNHKMGLLIDDLLNFSRTGRAELKKSLISMQQVLEEALAQINHLTAQRKVTWQIGSMPEIYGDYNLLRQVWINLLDNAVKYTREKDEAVIKIECVRNDSEFVFSVQDNGVGFEMAHAAKLFGVFQRLHVSPRFEGTGIGLANVQRIIIKHGGRTWAEAKPNNGAVFYFSIPVQNI